MSPSEDILTYEEIERVARAAVALGVDSIRLTGGEPLVRREICSLVERLARIPGLADLSLTTNGLLLQPLADSLRAAGLRRVNISLDALEEERFRRLTGGDVSQVLAGIEAALEAGLEPVKLNVVLLAEKANEFSEADILLFIEMTRKRPLHVRFIEWMPVNGGVAGDFRPVLASEVKKALLRIGELIPFTGPVGSGPARYYRFAEAAGSIGFIAPLSAPFCDKCSRLRLTSTGRLKPCLLDAAEIDLRTPLRAGAGDAEIAALFQQAACRKPASYCNGKAASAYMCQIGG